MGVRITGDITGDHPNSPLSLRNEEKEFNNHGAIISRYIGGTMVSPVKHLDSYHSTIKDYYLDFSSGLPFNSDFVEKSGYGVKLLRQSVYRFNITYFFSGIGGSGNVLLGIRYNGVDYVIASNHIDTALISGDIRSITGYLDIDLAPNSIVYPFFKSSYAFNPDISGVSSFSIHVLGWMSGGTGGGGGGGSGSQISTSALYFHHVTLDSSMIDNKFIILPKNVSSGQDINTILDLKGFPEQFYADDYIVNPINRNRISWDGLGLEDLVIEGDKIRVMFI